MRYIFAFAIFICGLHAQAPPLNFVQAGCPIGAPAGSNYLYWTGPTPFPLCAIIGPTLKLTNVNGHTQLDAVIPTPAPAQAPPPTVVGATTPAVSFTDASNLAIGANCSIQTVCNIGWGGVVTQFTTSGKLTFTGGDGQARIYVDGTVSPSVIGVALSGTLAATCTMIACNVTRGAQFPPDSLPLASWTASAGAGWDAQGGVDFRAFLNSIRLVGGPGINLVCFNGTCTISAISNQ